VNFRVARLWPSIPLQRTRSRSLIGRPPAARRLLGVLAILLATAAPALVGCRRAEQVPGEVTVTIENRSSHDLGDLRVDWLSVGMPGRDGASWGSLRRGESRTRRYLIQELRQALISAEVDSCHVSYLSPYLASGTTWTAVILSTESNSPLSPQNPCRTVFDVTATTLIRGEA
jgi:hypothetical protein